MNENKIIFSSYNICYEYYAISRKKRGGEEILPNVIKDLANNKNEKYDKLLSDFIKATKLSGKDAKKVDNEMKKILLSKKDDDAVKLLVAFKHFDEYKILYDELQMSMGTYSQNEDRDTLYHINGKELSIKELKAHINHKDQAIDGYLKRQNTSRKEMAKKIHTYLKENKIASSLDYTKGDNTYFTTTMTKKELKKFLSSYADSIKSIGLNAEHSYSVDSAMIATRVDPVVLDWTPQRNNQRGGGIGIYFSDAQCNDPEDVEGLYHEFNGTEGDASNNGHTFLVGGVIASVAPDAFKYCKNANYVYEDVLPTANEVNSNPRIRVESYSLNRNYADSNVYNTEDAIFDEHVRDFNIPVFISAGNHNNGESVVVETPAHAYNIITVGNYNDATDTIHVVDDNSVDNQSNYANPNVGNEKPELVAPGTDISYTFNGRSVYNNYRTGTSFATPHAAAIAADILAENPFLQNNVPVLKAMMLAASTDPIDDVDDAEVTGDSAVGAGGINVQRPIYNDRFAAYWYDPDGNGPFSWSGTSSCYTGWTFSAPSYYAHARIAFTWEINEDYVLNNNTHGTVLYFYVTDTNGGIVTTSFDGSTEYPNTNN